MILNLELIFFSLLYFRNSLKINEGALRFTSIVLSNILLQLLISIEKVQDNYDHINSSEDFNWSLVPSLGEKNE